MDARNCVIDLSHHNGTRLDFKAAYTDGIRWVIHKATQGVRFVDPNYLRNREAATAAGLHWGAYHFATGDDPEQQVIHFLTTVGDVRGMLLALDLETNPAGSSMSLTQARQFVLAMQNRTGRWPLLYSGVDIKRMLGNQRDPILANCGLWLAQYGPKPVWPANWEHWTLWQYTDGTFGPEPHRVKGIGGCDRSWLREEDVRRVLGE